MDTRIQWWEPSVAGGYVKGSVLGLTADGTPRMYAGHASEQNRARLSVSLENRMVQAEWLHGPMEWDPEMVNARLRAAANP